jgi:hypothetical protein
MPEPQIMDAEVGVALEDWERIPTHELSALCAEARRRSNGFPPSNSLVVDVWAEVLERRNKEAREREMLLPRDTMPDRTPEEKAELDKFFSTLRGAL